MGLQEHSWFFDLIRSIFGFFDRLVYGLIKWILYGIFDLSALSTNSNVFNGIYSRIYVILGIFMAFKLSFSFFQYIISPDTMGEKGDKGVGKLFTRVFLMLFALMVLPSILFGGNGGPGLLSRAQNAFLPVVPKLIFGAESIGGNNGVNGNASSVEVMADEISLATLRGFFYPSKEVDEVCAPDTSSKYKEITSLDDFASKVKETCSKRGSLVGIFAAKYYVYDYLPLVSTVVGILVGALLLGITLDIAKRIFKLIVLEIIAPIPIMSIIDPKGSKGNAFQSWTKSLINTFIDIFLKLGLVYLVIVLIHMICKANESGGLFNNFPQFEDNPVRASYLVLLLILGLIFFAKEAPKFIKEALGIHDSGGGLFDDVKTMGRIAGRVTGAAAGVAVGAMSGVAGGIAQGANTDGNFLKKLGVGAASSIGGSIAGAIRGGANGSSGAKKGNTFAGIGKAFSGQKAVNAGKVANAQAGSNMLGRAAARIGGILGETPADHDERMLTGYKGAIDAAKNFKTVLSDSAGKSNYGATVNGKSGVTLKGFKGALAAANGGNGDALNELKSTYGYSSLSEANAKAAEFEKEYGKQYYAAVASGAITDGDAAAVRSAKSLADASIDKLGLTDLSGARITDVTAANAGVVIGAATSKSNEIKTKKTFLRGSYTSRKRSAEAVKKNKK